MAKRGARQAPPMATAGAVAHATGNQTAVNLHAWANQPGMPAAHSPEAHQERRAPTAPLTPEQVRAFNHAEAHYEASHMQPSGQQPLGPSGKPRGFQIHRVQAAAQAARGARYDGPNDDGSN